MATLTITFTGASGSYIVKYRKVSVGGAYTTTTAASSPVVITGVDNESYEGTVQKDCGSGNLSSEAAWTASVGCTRYTNSTGALVSPVNYVDCDGTEHIGAGIANGQSICVQDGTLGGANAGLLTYSYPCTQDRHLDSSQYSTGGGGAITGTCTIENVIITRNQGAADDSTIMGQNVLVDFDISTDNGITTTQQVTILAGQLQSAPININHNAGGNCSAIDVFVITSVNPI
jgi:hypothetical protein